MLKTHPVPPYKRWDGPGTVKNVRAAVRKMVEEAPNPEDRIVFITSSHGNGDGNGNSYLCLLPDPIVGQTQNERSGCYMDKDLAEDLSGSAAGTFVFIGQKFSFGY